VNILKNLKYWQLYFTLLSVYVVAGLVITGIDINPEPREIFMGLVLFFFGVGFLVWGISLGENKLWGCKVLDDSGT